MLKYFLAFKNNVNPTKDSILFAIRYKISFVFEAENALKHYNYYAIYKTLLKDIDCYFERGP